MTEDDDPVIFVCSWIDKRFPSGSPTEFARLDSASRRVIALVRASGQQMNGAFPSVYYNGLGYMMPDATACLHTIGTEKMASIAQAYVDAITTNPYLGPPEVWPTREAPEGSASEADQARVDALDDAYWDAQREFGLDRFWEALATEVRRIQTAEPLG